MQTAVVFLALVAVASAGFLSQPAVYSAPAVAVAQPVAIAQPVVRTVAVAQPVVRTIAVAQPVVRTVAVAQPVVRTVAVAQPALAYSAPSTLQYQSVVSKAVAGQKPNLAITVAHAAPLAVAHHGAYLG